MAAFWDPIKAIVRACGARKVVLHGILQIPNRKSELIFPSRSQRDYHVCQHFSIPDLSSFWGPPSRSITGSSNLWVAHIAQTHPPRESASAAPHRALSVCLVWRPCPPPCRCDSAPVVSRAAMAKPNCMIPSGSVKTNRFALFVLDFGLKVPKQFS